MKVILVLTCLLAAFLGLAACSSAPEDLSVDMSNSGQEVTISNGGILTVKLDSNASTGYSWTADAAVADNTVLKQTDHIYQPPATAMPGAGGQEAWNFKGLKAGKTTISMDYRRPFETNVAPVKTFSITVVVK
jgi:inhibitor of cysteine peptidase